MADLPLNIYDFLIRTIRDEDKLNGGEFLRRYLQGHQAIWQQIHDKILSLPDLSSPVLCPDDLLPYLKNIVGWTKKLDPITKNLAAPVLRRLIQSSAAFWKSRTSEDAILDVVNLMFTPYATIWNWFDARWITGLTSPPSTVLGEQRQGRDPYLVTFPSAIPGCGPYQTVIRVVMPEDRELFKDVMGLMRPAGEYFLLVYLALLDRFNVDGELSQWELFMGTDQPTVSDGYVQLDDDTQQEALGVIVDGADAWDHYIVYSRLRGQCPALPGSDDGFGLALGFDEATDTSPLLVALDVPGNAVHIKTLTAGVEATVSSIPMSSFGITLQEDIWYGLRIQIEPPVLGASAYKVYLDGVLIDDSTCGDCTGTVAIFHSADCQVECDELEVMPLPAETDLLTP